MSLPRVLSILFLSVMLNPVSQAREDVPVKIVDPRKRVIAAKDLPDQVEWLEDTEGKVRERARKALLAGPEALEKLAAELQTAGMRDKDGRYTTPYFFREITANGNPIGQEERRPYQQRIFQEWRKKFPASKAAVLAGARLHAELAYAAKQKLYGVEELDQKWVVVREELKKATAALEECVELREKDPAWAATYFVVVDALGEDREGMDRMAALVMEKFPDCGYVLARAVLYRLDRREPEERELVGIWLLRLLENLPPNEAAKLYVETYAAVANFRGVIATFNILQPDRDKMVKGLDLLAAERPDDIMVATQEAALSAWALQDRARALSALKRAGGTLDLEFLAGEKVNYERLIGFIRSIPWNETDVGLPPFSGYVSASPVDTRAKMQEAVAAGPAGLEAHIRKIRAEEPWDLNGRSASIRFYEWFGIKVTNLETERLRKEREEILEQWRKEYPDSPFAKLASAYYWISRAWDARSAAWAHQVDERQWRGFAEGLAKVRGYLAASAELQETDPAWSDAALTLNLGEGDQRDDFEDITDAMFRNFPECPQTLSAAIYTFRPRWGGKAGAWEPWLLRKLEGMPEDVRARTYALAVIGEAGYAFESKENEQEIFGGKKPDMDLVRKGLALLKKKHPASIRYPSAEAMFLCKYNGQPGDALEAMKKLEGKVDLSVWNSRAYHQRCVDWVTWKMVEQAQRKTTKPEPAR